MYIEYNIYDFNVAMVNKNILKIRKKLDKLDNLFLDLIKKSTKLVDEVLMNKKFKKDIIDKKRIKIILILFLSIISFLNFLFFRT